MLDWLIGRRQEVRQDLHELKAGEVIEVNFGCLHSDVNEIVPCQVKICTLTAEPYVTHQGRNWVLARSRSAHREASVWLATLIAPRMSADEFEAFRGWLEHRQGALTRSASDAPHGIDKRDIEAYHQLLVRGISERELRRKFFCTIRRETWDRQRLHYFDTLDSFVRQFRVLMPGQYGAGHH
jgi:hypothetical protein